MAWGVPCVPPAPGAAGSSAPIAKAAPRNAAPPVAGAATSPIGHSARRSPSSRSRPRISPPPSMKKSQMSSRASASRVCPSPTRPIQTRLPKDRPSLALIASMAKWIAPAATASASAPPAREEKPPSAPTAAALVKSATTSQEKFSPDPQASSRASLQVLELARIPYTKVDYRFENQDYVFYVYDSEGKEKFYADRYPARWDRIERLVRSITSDLMTPAPASSQPNNPNPAPGYRVPIEDPPYTITEEDEEPHNN